MKQRSGPIKGFGTEDSVTQAFGTSGELQSTNSHSEQQQATSGSNVKPLFTDRVSGIDAKHHILDEVEIDVLKPILVTSSDKPPQEQCNIVHEGRDQLSLGGAKPVGDNSQMVKKGGEMVPLRSDATSAISKSDSIDSLQVMIVDGIDGLGATVELIGNSSPKSVNGTVPSDHDGSQSGSSQVVGKERPNKLNKQAHPNGPHIESKLHQYRKRFKLQKLSKISRCNIIELTCNLGCGVLMLLVEQGITGLVNEPIIQRGVCSFGGYG